MDNPNGGRIMKKSGWIRIVMLVVIAAGCSLSYMQRLAARYYRLTDKEKKTFLGFKATDSSLAATYLDLTSASERASFYDTYWQGNEEERSEFEDRTDFAVREFGRYEPLNDDRLPIYIKYGMPTDRTVYSQQKMMMSVSKDIVKPAEIWTYKSTGIEFDFVQEFRAFKNIAMTESGKQAKIRYLNDDTTGTFMTAESTGILDYDLTFGRFVQERGLTRVEFYLNIEIADTTLPFLQAIEVYDSRNESLVCEVRRLLKPIGEDAGLYYDELNLWLPPRQYRAVYRLYDLKNRKAGKKDLNLNLLEYAEEAKKISDLVPAALIDDFATVEKFRKPPGRFIPLARNAFPVHKPFYLYHEVYNLETDDSLHQLRTTYEVYNKVKMKKEIVDVMIQEEIGKSRTAYLTTKYHPMDLPAGKYIIISHDTDVMTGKECSAIFEFELTGK
jgi:hypothetical protein